MDGSQDWRLTNLCAASLCHTRDRVDSMTSVSACHIILTEGVCVDGERESKQKERDRESRQKEREIERESRQKER